MPRVDLRALACGQECQVRIPGICRGGTETTVLAHVRMVGISGAGMKAPDLLGAHCCMHCHRVVDGQVKSKYSKDERRLMLLEGVCRTIYWLSKNGYLGDGDE